MPIDFVPALGHQTSVYRRAHLAVGLITQTNDLSGVSAVRERHGDEGVGAVIHCIAIRLCHLVPEELRGADGIPDLLAFMPVRAAEEIAASRPGLSLADAESHVASFLDSRAYAQRIVTAVQAGNHLAARTLIARIQHVPARAGRVAALMHTAITTLTRTAAA